MDIVEYETRYFGTLILLSCFQAKETSVQYTEIVNAKSKDILE